ncbi:MAG: DUF2238 domain-containing protein [Gammaproteobacteria bacterium]
MNNVSVKVALWSGIFFAVLIWSAIAPHDYPTWFLEVSPAVIGFIILAATRNRFPLTPLAYVLILVHMIILMIGGHYTYAEVPYFDSLGGLIDWQRNNYDKLGHFAQGFVPAIIARELFIRLAVVNGRVWLNVIVVALCLAISALYELVEWWVALISEEAAESFLGTQGYIWDTQSDMGWALLGAVIGLLILGRLHDRQLACLREGSAGP